MNDEIETLRNSIEKWIPDTGEDIEAIVALKRLTARLADLQRCAVQGQEMAKEQMDRCIAVERERDSLRKALDDRFAADQRAAKAIFAATDRTAGFPSVKEVVAYYIADAERLEKERDEWKNQAHILRDRCQLIEPLLGEQSAKLERAKEAIDAIISAWDDKQRVTAVIVCLAIEDARAVLAELSADAPAQQKQTSDVRPEGFDAVALGALRKSAKEVTSVAAMREAMAEAEKALEPFARVSSDDSSIDAFEIDETNASQEILFGDLRHARVALAKLRSVMK